VKEEKVKGKRGRKLLVFEQNFIDEIVYRFVKDKNIDGKIKYSNVYDYTLELYKLGEIEYKFSEDFWRRNGKQGKETIDRFNHIYEQTLISNSKNNNLKVLDSNILVENFLINGAKDKKRLIQQLRLNEKVALKSLELQNKIEELESEIDKLAAKNKYYEQRVVKYEKLFFSWFNASNRNDMPLIELNKLDINNPIIETFLIEMFKEPAKGFDELEIQGSKKSTTKTRLELLSSKRKK